MATIGNVEKTSEGFLWRIGDIFTLTKDKNYSSPSFSFADNDWNLAIERENKIDCINVNLRKLPNFSPISIKYCMILKTLDGKKDKEYCRCDIDEMKLESGCYRSISIPESFVRETEQVPSNVLAVLCTLKLPKPIDDKNDESLTQVYKNVLLNGKNHDLILKIGEKELRAHKDILRARSHVFESMLDHDMKEKRSGVIDVPDCDPEAMELFLSYIYCGKVEIQDQNNMIGLYYIADKYDMKGLKEECSDIIIKSLSNANICDVIQLALKHSDSRLLQYSTEHFISNALDIMRTVEWQIFLKDNTTVGNELLIKSLEKKNNIVSHKSASSDMFCGSLDDPLCPIKKKSASSDTFCGFIDDYASSVENYMLRLKYEYQNDNTAETTQDKRDENRTENISPYLPKNAIEAIRSKYKYPDDNVIETSQKERTKSRTQYVLPSMYEKSVKVIRSKYKYQDDNVIETSQKERTKSRTQYAASSMSEKSVKDDNIIETNQKERTKSRTQYVAPFMSEKSVEADVEVETRRPRTNIKKMLRQKYVNKCIDDIRASQKELESKTQMLRQKCMYECTDDIRASQKELESKTQDSPPMSESKAMLRQKYLDECFDLDEYIDDILASQKELESKTQDFSPPMSETTKEVPPVNETYFRLCPRCQTPNEKRFGGGSMRCAFCFINFF